MIRSLAARNLSARQKSNIRNIAYRLGGYVRRPVEVLVEDVVVHDGARTFLQIGANDGYLSDPLNLAIFRHKLTGTFVEPQSNYYRELQRTYRDFPGMLFLQYAIAQKSGAMTMYTLDCSSGRLPGWAQGVGTLSREQIRKFGDQIDNIESYIRADEVQCITVADLLGRAAHRDPDIIVVDAEGFDHAILSQFDFGRLSTKLVIYETESMTREDAADLAQRLEEAGLRSSKPIRTRSRCVGIPKRFAGKMRPKARPHSDGSARFDDMRGVRPLSSPRLVAVSPRSVQSKRHASQGGR